MFFSADPLKFSLVKRYQVTPEIFELVNVRLWLGYLRTFRFVPKSQPSAQFKS